MLDTIERLSLDRILKHLADEAAYEMYEQVCRKCPHQGEDSALCLKGERALAKSLAKLFIAYCRLN